MPWPTLLFGPLGPGVPAAEQAAWHSSSSAAELADVGLPNHQQQQGEEEEEGWQQKKKERPPPRRQVQVGTRECASASGSHGASSCASLASTSEGVLPSDAAPRKEQLKFRPKIFSSSYAEPGCLVELSALNTGCPPRPGAPLTS
jgi:hypothetical protein